MAQTYSSQVSIPTEVAVLAPDNIQNVPSGLGDIANVLGELASKLQATKDARQEAQAVAAYNDSVAEYQQSLIGKDPSEDDFVRGLQLHMQTRKGRILEGTSRNVRNRLQNQFTVWDQKNEAQIGMYAIKRETQLYEEGMIPTFEMAARAGDITIAENYITAGNLSAREEDIARAKAVKIFEAVELEQRKEAFDGALVNVMAVTSNSYIEKAVAAGRDPNDPTLQDEAFKAGMDAAVKFGTDPRNTKAAGLLATDTSAMVNVFESNANANMATSKLELEVKQESSREEYWDKYVKTDSALDKWLDLQPFAADEKIKMSEAAIDRAKKILEPIPVITSLKTGVAVRDLIAKTESGDITRQQALDLYYVLAPNINDKEEPGFLDKIFAASKAREDEVEASILKRGSEIVSGRDKYLRSSIGRSIPPVLIALDKQLQTSLATELSNELAEKASIDLSDSFPNKNLVTDTVEVDKKVNELIRKYSMSPDALSAAIDARQIQDKKNELQRAKAQMQLINQYRRMNLPYEAKKVLEEARLKGLPMDDVAGDKLPPVNDSSTTNKVFKSLSENIGN